MSATSKLVGFPVNTEDESHSTAKQADADRRRYLMRYVVGALGLAGIICMAAGVRLVMARSAGAHEETWKPSLPAVVAAPATPEPVQKAAEPAVNPAPVPVAPAAQAAE